MGACEECRHCWHDGMLGFCSLTNLCVNEETDSCIMFNKDLSELEICYNCKYYIGYHDWGMFCSHDDMYHHIGNFNDAPCQYYVTK